MCEFLPSESYFKADYWMAEVKYFNSFWHFVCHINEISEQPLMRYVWGGVVEVYFREGKPVVILRESSCVDVNLVEAISVEIIFGMVFCLWNKNKQSISKSFAPYSEDFLHFKMQEHKPLASSQQVMEVSCNWKLLVEISLDETHVIEVHPEYSQLMKGATDYRAHNGIRSWQQRVGFPGFKNIFAMMYWILIVVLKMKKKWTYFWIFPNLEIEIYPEQVIIYQIVPISPQKSLKISSRYGLKSTSPFIYIMRSLNKKIQDHIDKQDISCVLSLQRSLSSRSFHKKHLAKGDGLVKKFYEIVRESYASRNI